MPVLYLVATPIGNLEDISRRALRTLGEVSLIACEDTRRTRHLLTSYEIKKPLTSYNEHNKKEKTALILSKLEQGDVALVSDGGMPAICDPGRELVGAARRRGFGVTVIPGPSAVTTALALSGLPADSFVFLGFLPSRRGGRRRRLEAFAVEENTLVVQEAPHRLRAALGDMLEILGEREVTVCRELTKLYEEAFSGSLSAALSHFSEPRGEFTLVIAGGRPETAAISEQVYTRIDELRRQGSSARDAVAALATASGRPRRELYRLWLERRGKDSTEGE